MSTSSWRGWQNRIRAQVRPPRRRPVPPAVEELRWRPLPSLTVDTGGDDGEGGTPADPKGPGGPPSLRQASELVNAGSATTILMVFTARATWSA